MSAFDGERTGAFASVGNEVIAMDMEKSENIVQLETAIKQPDREYYLDKLARFRLLDDDFMTQVFQDNTPAVELLLNIILDKDDTKVTGFETQRVISGRGLRSIRMDIHTVDSEGKQSDIEVQRADRGADPRRARFHSAVLDSTMLNPKQDFKEMADSVIIFITENDYFGDGKPIRSYTRRCDQEPMESLGDGNRIIYVNGAYKNDDEPIGRLMHDFRCVSAVDMFYSELADKVRELKETKGGQDRMCRLMEDMRNEAQREGEKKGILETLFGLVKDGILSVSDAAKRANMNVADFEKAYKTFLL